MRMVRAGNKLCYADATQYHLLDLETRKDTALFPHNLVAREVEDGPGSPPPGASASGPSASASPAPAPPGNGHRTPQIELIDNTDFLLASMSKGTPARPSAVRVRGAPC